MAIIYYENDADLSLLQDKTIGIVGYGSQGHAHALSLRDSGLKVMVGLYQGSPSWEKAEAEGLDVDTVDELTKKSDLIMMLVPDHLQSRIYRDSVEPHLEEGKTLLFAHGFNIHYQQITPPNQIDVTMVAPKAPGHRMREIFVQGSGVPGLLAIHQNQSGKAKEISLAYAKGIGCTKAGVLETTFKEETETDLFGEQVILCGGISSLIKASFETLVEAGYQPESAFFETMHELKLIVDLIYQGGLSYMRYSVSDTAEYGDYVSGPRIVDDNVKQSMKQILQEIQDGSFARQWIAENDEGRPRFNIMRQQDASHPVEEVGKTLRDMMGFLKQS